jgi:acetyl esterase/lipase
MSSSTLLSPTPGPLVLPGHPAMALRIHGRRPARGRTALVLHLHGGAFTHGDLDSGECLAQLLADTGAVVVSLAYPLAPAHPFPQAVEAVYAALEWLQANRRRLAGADATLFVAGEEAGGNLATAAALMARDRDTPALAGLVLVTPMLDPCIATASQREAMGDKVECKWAEGWQQYLRSPMDAEHPYAVPAFAQRLAGLPPTLVLAGEDDPMRDEAMAFAQRLRQAEVPVRTSLIPATGWPESLERTDVPCPCAAVVQGEFSAFLAAPMPPPA